MRRKKVGIIFAFDKSTFGETDRAMLRSIAPYIAVVKIGLEAITADDEKTGRSVATLIAEFCALELGIDIMYDIKLLDVANTIDRAVQNIRIKGYRFFTMHALVSDISLDAIGLLDQKDPLALAVTVLTDLDDHQSRFRFGNDAPETVRRFAINAYERGVRGFVCSAKEAKLIRETLPDHHVVTIVTPAIRPRWAVANEQVRITTPTHAMEFGADYIVVGRPISSPPQEIGDSETAAKAIWYELNPA